jgi:hypothetical protein
MKTFLAIYLGKDTHAVAKWNAMEEADRHAAMRRGMKAWGDWMTAHADVIAVEGGPLGKTKRASAAGVTDVKNAMTGYVIVQAESHEAAARMFEGHPHFAIFPGEAVEIMECLPMPGAG